MANPDGRPARVPPLPKDQWGDDEYDAITALGMPRASLVENPGPPSNILGTFARYPALASAFLTFNRHVSNSALPKRVLEIAVIRIVWLRRAQYGWSNHVVYNGPAAGLTEAEMTAIGEGATAAVWSEFEAAVVRATDSLCEHAMISDPDWQTLSGELDELQLMDLVFAVGAYDTLAMAMNSFKVELDPGMIDFPG
jgi:alkylhydroperoxidase family enzyme